MQTGQDTASNYHSYILRVWSVESVLGQTWRASLERVGSGERHGFVDLVDLFAFLDRQYQAAQKPGGAEPASGAEA